MTIITDLLRPVKRLTNIYAHVFARNWQMFYLNQRKEENDRRKYFMINSSGGRTCDRLNISQTRIWLSHRGRRYAGNSKSCRKECSLFWCVSRDRLTWPINCTNSTYADRHASTNSVLIGSDDAVLVLGVWSGSILFLSPSAFWTYQQVIK